MKLAIIATWLYGVIDECSETAAHNEERPGNEASSPENRLGRQYWFFWATDVSTFVFVVPMFQKELRERLICSPDRKMQQNSLDF